MPLTRPPALRGFIIRSMATGLAIAALFPCQQVSAQAAGGQGVASALQAFGNLSQDQQNALMQKLTGQGNAPANSQPAPTQKNPASATASAANGAATQATPPGTLQPGDQVLVQVNLPGQKTTAQQSADAYERELQATQAGIAPLATAQSPAGPGDATPASAAKGPQAPLSAKALDDLGRLIEVIARGNPYRLDAQGQLQLPGFRPIALAGLDSGQATQRLAAEPALANLEVKVLPLPVARSGPAALQPYGYDVFTSSPGGLSQAGAVSVPPDYVVQAGDELDVQLYGSQNNSLQLIVSRDGQVNFPQLGPIGVAGKSYATVKRDIESRVARQMIGVRASLTIGQLGTISVFVLGEAAGPGAYPLTGTATVTSALFAAGGVRPKGSLRHIQVRRGGKLVREFDLYDLLMQGDSSNDVKLMAGDVVMVPAIGPTVTVDGEVQRPAIYELKGRESVAELVQMAGGLTPEGDADGLALVQLNAQKQRVVLAVKADADVALGNGDLLHVARLRPQIDAGVVVQGHVWRPGNYAWREGLRVADVIPNVDELQPGADAHYALIRRELPPDRHVVALSADLAAAWADPASAANVPLQARDTVTVFDLQTGRERLIEPLMQEIARQASAASQSAQVLVDGRVHVPGTYPLEQGMRVADLLRAGGGLAPEAYQARAELSRFQIIDGEQRRVAIVPVDLAAVMRGDAAANLALQPYDQLSVKDVSGWSDSDTVTLKGEVKLPGTYSIRRGETLSSVIERAGGLTELAFPAGAVLTREELRQREQVELDRLADRMQHDITAMSLMAARSTSATAANAATADLSIGKTLLSQLQSTKAVGRLVIDLPTMLKEGKGSPQDVALRDGDVLVIPRLRQEVMVLGEVQNATSQLYQPDWSRDDYIQQSGGATRLADKSHIYVVRADGRVAAPERGFLFSYTRSTIKPGDAIVVPMNVEKLPALPTWQAITTILYNVAIAAAALHAL